MDSNGNGTLFPTIEDAVAAYAAYFFPSSSNSSTVIELASQVIFGLESNWAGQPANNPSIDLTMNAIQQLSAMNYTLLMTNWRMQAFAYRSAYDCLIKVRLAFEQDQLEQAYSLLAVANVDNVAAILSKASSILAAPNTNPGLTVYVNSINSMYANLNITIGVMVLASQQPDLGVYVWNQSISDVAFLSSAVADITQLLNASAQVSAVSALLQWTSPAPNTIYDNLGDIDPASHPHLDAGQGALTGTY